LLPWGHVSQVRLLLAPTIATDERCSHLPVADVNLKLSYFFLVKFMHFYEMKYGKNLCAQIDTSTTSSYTTTYNNIVYFISIAYTITTMHTHKLLDLF
jgi:hypothetical protein